MSQLLEQVLNQILRHSRPNSFRRSHMSVLRSAYRNGTRPHPLTTRVGTITLRVPRLRNGTFSS
ncbi:transposase [Alicyclobacillus suci]|uniref:transposase n=1 Tax=Alicyclobacillus suci TaxID=2816080 RepID=UPI0034DD7E40